MYLEFVEAPRPPVEGSLLYNQLLSSLLLCNLLLRSLLYIPLLTSLLHSPTARTRLRGESAWPATYVWNATPTRSAQKDKTARLGVVSGRHCSPGLAPPRASMHEQRPRG